MVRGQGENKERWFVLIFTIGGGGGTGTGTGTVSDDREVGG